MNCRTHRMRATRHQHGLVPPCIYCSEKVKTMQPYCWNNNIMITKGTWVTRWTRQSSAYVPACRQGSLSNRSSLTILHRTKMSKDVGPVLTWQTAFCLAICTPYSLTALRNLDHNSDFLNWHSGTPVTPALKKNVCTNFSCPCLFMHESSHRCKKNGFSFFYSCHGFYVFNIFLFSQRFLF